MLELGGNVERETVAHNPPRDAHANRRQLLVFDPHTCQPWHAAGVNPELPDRLNQGLFQIADVAMNIAAIRAQIHDGVADELTRTMVGDVAASAGFKDLDAFLLERLRRGDDMRAVVPCLHPE